MTLGQSTEIRKLAAAERAEFADLVSSLSPSQWEAQTLCTDWRVRDLAAHVISYDELDTRALFKRFARGRFSAGKVNAVGVAEYARPVEDLVRLIRDNLEPRGLPAGFGGRIALLDMVVHHQDVRRPLGLPREVPAERLLPALKFAMFAPPLRAYPRVRGLRLVATDLDWSFGSGPEVRGTGEALLMAAAGRKGVVQELSGPGQELFARRIGG